MEIIFTNAKNSFNTMTTDEKRMQNIEKAIHIILENIGEIPSRAGLEMTPNRIARMYKEIFRGYDITTRPKVTTFENGQDGIIYDSMIVDTGTYYSMCEHHMMPFFGKYYFAYIPNPNGKILGLSKIARLVDWHSARLQIQERLVSDIVSDIREVLGENNPPLGIALYMQGEHLCKTMRGVKKEGKMSCSYLTGVFKIQNETRQEFFNLINHG